MSKKLIIHIGWHKTASTVIQLYLDKHRDILKKYNICYPFIDNRTQYGNIKHADLVTSITNDLAVGKENKSVCSFDELFLKSLKEIKDSKCRWAILSEEGFSMQFPGIAKMMTRYKEHFDEVKIIAYIRRQDYFIESLYSQVVKQPVTKAKACFTEFVKRPWVKKRSNYAATLDWWAESFGLENVIVVPFEKHIIEPDPVTCFFDKSGLPKDVLKRLPPLRSEAHVTPPREVTEIYRYLNLNNINFDIEVLTEYLLQSGATLTNSKYFNYDDRTKILEKFEESNKYVAQKYLKKESGVLFEEPLEIYDNCDVTYQGFPPSEMPNYILPAIGMMSSEIDNLRRENQKAGKLARKIVYILEKFYFLLFEKKKKNI